MHGLSPFPSGPLHGSVAIKILLLRFWILIKADDEVLGQFEETGRVVEQALRSMNDRVLPLRDQFKELLRALPALTVKRHGGHETAMSELMPPGELIH